MLGHEARRITRRRQRAREVRAQRRAQRLELALGGGRGLGGRDAGGDGVHDLLLALAHDLRAGDDRQCTHQGGVLLPALGRRRHGVARGHELRHGVLLGAPELARRRVPRHDVLRQLHAELARLHLLAERRDGGHELLAPFGNQRHMRLGLGPQAFDRGLPIAALRVRRLRQLAVDLDAGEVEQVRALVGRSAQERRELALREQHRPAELVEVEAEALADREQHCSSSPPRRRCRDPGRRAPSPASAAGRRRAGAPAAPSTSRDSGGRRDR
ncbi:MAG: hypothetical protein U1E73_04095 [Planctomycetota bacterium]